MWTEVGQKQGNDVTLYICSTFCSTLSYPHVYAVLSLFYSFLAHILLCSSFGMTLFYHALLLLIPWYGGARTLQVHGFTSGSRSFDTTYLLASPPRFPSVRRSCKNCYRGNSQFLQICLRSDLIKAFPGFVEESVKFPMGSPRILSIPHGLPKGP